jgi:hypothetical protein
VTATTSIDARLVTALAAFAMLVLVIFILPH